MIPFYFLFFVGFPLFNSSTPTQSEAAYVANYTISQINAINGSGFGIFYPNLTKAYEYANIARRLSSQNPGLSIEYSYKALEAAEEAYKSIEKFRTISLLFFLVGIFAISLILFNVMKPVKAKKRPIFS
ncbi:MAG: hypothetical protein QXL16_02595 [Candidatus Micrarchaeaceae archaeon]